MLEYHAETCLVMSKSPFSSNLNVAKPDLCPFKQGIMAFTQHNTEAQRVLM